MNTEPQTDAEALATVSENQPNVAAMQAEYTRAWTDDVMTATRIRSAEAIRYNWWPGQHADGRMHQELLPEGKRAVYEHAPASGAVNTQP